MEKGGQRKGESSSGRDMKVREAENQSESSLNGLENANSLCIIV